MMSVYFKGWSRSVHPQGRRVCPVRRGGYGGFARIDEKQPLLWEEANDYDYIYNQAQFKGGMKAYGQLRAVSLNGNFLVRFQMNNNEIRSMLKAFIKSDPAAALELLSEVQIEATKSLLKASNK